jgi:hypothetical protein
VDATQLRRVLPAASSWIRTDRDAASHARYAQSDGLSVVRRVLIVSQTRESFVVPNDGTQVPPCVGGIAVASAAVAGAAVAGAVGGVAGATALPWILASCFLLRVPRAIAAATFTFSAPERVADRLGGGERLLLCGEPL